MNPFSCRILTITAFHQTEKDGDEIFLRVNGKKIWPAADAYSKMSNATVKVNAVVNLNQLGETVEVELWEYDNFISSHRLGKFVLNADKKGGPFVTDLSLQSDTYSRYSVEWEVV